MSAAGQSARTAPRRAGGISRLTPFDRMYLRDESPDWPCHFGGLAVLEGQALLDSAGVLRLAEIRERLDRRLARVPELRRRVYFPGTLRGGPLWVDDARFAIEQHVLQAAVPAPGGETELLETAAWLYGHLLDRRRPLWELWFLTGMSNGRVGLLLKLHHSVADGTAAVRAMQSLFDAAADAAEPAKSPWTPRPLPGSLPLLFDAFAAKARGLRRGVTALGHPRRLAKGARVVALVLGRTMGQKGAPRTSLNQVVRAGRRLRCARLDLAAVKQAAHGHDGKVNDVVLDLWAGGLRSLLVSRHERVAGVELATGQAISLRSSDDASVDNQAGTVVLRLPVWEPDPIRRLDLIVAMTRKVKARQQPAAIKDVAAAMATSPLAPYFNRHQKAANVIVTNVPGPPRHMHIMGARVNEILPIIPLIGNIGLTLCALSYAGQISLVVTADATAFPDLEVLTAAMEREWEVLASQLQ